MSDEPKGYYFPPQSAKTPPLLRMYFEETNRDTLRLWLNTGTFERRYSFPLPPGHFLTQSRAFDSIPKGLHRREPLVVFYGNEDTIMACPGDAKPESIISLYKLVVLIFAEPLKL